MNARPIVRVGKARVMKIRIGFAGFKDESSVVTMKQCRASEAVRRSRHGTAILWTAHVWIVLLIAVGAFAVDLGKYLYASAVTRDAIDSAALAASTALENGADPRAAAVAMITENSQSGVTIDPSLINVATGFWNSGTRTFTANGSPANAVRVTSSQPYTSGVFARPSSQIDATSIAHFQQRDIVLVLDYSGSMLTRDKYKALKEAVKDFCDVVEAVGNGKDRVAMISYSDAATLQSGFASNLNPVRSRIDASVYNGATNIYDGLKTAIDLVNGSARPASDRMVILLTDGLANRPLNVDAYQYAKNQAERARTLGLPVYTVSFGSDADPTLMQYIANTTGTQHYHADDPTPQSKDQLRTVFRELAHARGAHFVK